MELVSIEEFKVTLGDFDSKKVERISGESTLREALNLMESKKIGSLIVDDVGIITERDFVRKVKPGQLDDLKVKDVATMKATFLKEDDVLLDALKLIEFLNIRHVPFRTKSGEIEMIGARDFLFFFRDKFKSIRDLGTVTYSKQIIADAHDEAFAGEMIESADGYFSESVFYQPVRKAIQYDVATIDTQRPLSEALEKMSGVQGAVLITEFDSRVVGIITERDFLRKIFGKNIDVKNTKVSEFMTEKPHQLLSRHTIGVAINNMAEFKYRSLAIVDEDKMPIALISIVDILSLIARKVVGIN